MSLGTALSLPYGSFGMAGEEGNKQPYFQLNGQNMTVDQYNQMNRQKVMDAAQRQGREVVAPSYPGQTRFSLFGPIMLPTPLTEAQFKAKGEYAASRRGTPEHKAFTQKINSLIQSGVGVGYGNYAKDGKVYHQATGQQVTGYGYGGLSVPQFFSNTSNANSNSTGSQSMGNQTGRQGQSSYQSNAFMDGLNTQLGNYDGYTVNSDLDAAEQNLRAMLANAQNNNADASTIGRIQMALDDIGRLGQDRTSQQGIIDQARRDAQANLTSFGGAYTDVDYRNAQALDGLSRQLDQIVNPNLDVELNYDFSDMSGDIDPYREIVQNMRDRRMRELDGLGDTVGNLGDVLNAFYQTPGSQTDPEGNPLNSTMPVPDDLLERGPLTPELRDIRSASEVYDLRDQLSEALQSIDAYGYGDRSNELRGQIFEQDEIYGQLADQLRGRQGQIETDAQAQLNALAEARLTRPDDIRAFEEALRDLGGQRDLFDAATAADELERLTSQIQSARSDLERDEAARIARQEIERRRALQTQGGGSAFNSNMTADQYSAYLRNLGMGTEDPYYQTSGFSRGLGLA